MIDNTYPAIRLLLDNKLVDGSSASTIDVINPATGEPIGSFRPATPADLDQALASADRAFRDWRRRPALERSDILRKAANLIRERQERISRIMTLEQGKTLPESRTEVAGAAGIFDWFAEEGRRAYGRVIPSRAEGIRFLTKQEPVGPVAAFTPWNFPAVIPARKIAGALAAGCSCIIKPAEETPGTTLELAQALIDAGLPEGILSVVIGNPAEISEYLIASPVIRKVSFTGSTAVGKHIGRLAAAGVKRVTLELGGHAPVIVTSDADLTSAAVTSAAFKYRNAGQVCISPTRFFVQEDVYDRFVEGFAERASALSVGDGMSEESQMGPLANDRRIAAMDDLTTDAVRVGARVVTGGNRLSNRGYFFEPTVLADVPASARIMREEPFGPVAVMNRFSSLDEAIAMANALPYGLAAYAFTGSNRTSLRLGDEIEAGMVAINNIMINFPETPFGGVKESGIGSEGGSEGLQAYLDTKLITEA